MKLGRKIGLVAGSIFLAWMIISAIVVKGLGIGNVTGIVVAVLFLLYVGYMPEVHMQIKELWKSDKMRVPISVAGIGIATVIVLVVIETGCMISACNQVPAENATVVVLGCKVNDDKPSLSLEERLIEAYDYLSKNPDAACIVTGGKGDDENISEAECMYRWLVDKGIDKNRIFREDRAASTKENILYAKEIIAENDLNSDIVVITSDYHTYRAGITAREVELGFGSSPSHTSVWIFPSFYIRELYAILFEWVF